MPDEVTPIAAAGVEHRACPDSHIAAQNLVEYVNVDLAELFLNRHEAAGTPDSSDLLRSRSITRSGTSSLMSPPSRKTPLMRRELT